MSLAQRGQEAALHERQHRKCRAAQQHHGQNRRARALIDAGEQTGVARLEPFTQWRLFCFSGTACQQRIGKRRGKRQRHHQRSHDGRNIGDCQRAEQAAGDAGQRQYRHEHQRHDEGGVDHCTAYFERCVQYHLRRIQRRGQQAVFAQAPENVFHIDNGIVHHLADGDGESAQRHGIEADAEVIQHDHRSQQRERNRGGRNDRCARVEQEQEQHDQHQRSADQQRGAQVADRGFNEVGRTEQVGIQRHAFGSEGGFELREALFQRPGHGQGIRAVLFLDHQHHARLPLDRSRTDCGGGRHRHIRDVCQVQGGATLIAQHHRSQRCGGDGLPGGFQRDALVVVFDDAGAAHCGCPFCRIDHVLDRQAVAHQLVGGDLDLQLLHLTAKYGNARHPVHGKQLRFNAPVGKGAQFHQRARLRGQTEAQHHAGG